MLLIVGSSQDHNVNRLANAAEARGYPYRLVQTDRDPAPVVSWQPGSTDLTIDGETFSAKGTSLFIRYDVFSDRDASQKAAFYDALRGWAEAYPEVGMLNRKNETMEVSKPRALVLAAQAGFDVPETWVTGDFNRFAGKKDDYIAKPVTGGAYTKVLSDMPETPDRPWLVQKKLAYPELRLFRVGRHYFAFEITSGVIDYRVDKDFKMAEVTPPPHLVAAMEKLTGALGLDYAAADLKTNLQTGKLEFMEINTMPMFTGYDDVAKGRLSDALAITLRSFSAQSRKRPPAQPQPE